ncbi:MAG TPA: hypothetical protein VFB33_09915 [Candidatus Binataceae bacterium]|jgi:hypothetical protein|nr:hypothetical protein [Candidatus Binataceae bacterium]
MQSRKVNQESRGKWLSPWNFVVFALGAAVGATLSPFYGPAYAVSGIIVTCWLAALLLVAFDRRIVVPHAGSLRRRGGRAISGLGGNAISAAAHERRSAGRGAPSTIEARRARLRPIIGGKSEPPSRAS